MSKIPIYSEKRPSRTNLHHACAIAALAGGIAITGVFALVSPDQAQAQDEAAQHRHADDGRRGLERFRCLCGRRQGARSPDPQHRSLAKEGAMFTSWYGQSSCTAGRSSFITGRIPIRSALSVVVAPGRRERPEEGNADDRRVLQEEWLHRPTSRASGIWATSPSSTRSSTASTR